MAIKLIDQELEAPDELPDTRANEIEQQLKAGMIKQFKQIPGPIVKVDPKIYDNGRGNSLAVFGWTKFQKITVPFIIKTINDEFGTDGAQLTVKPLYFWTLSPENSQRFWQTVLKRPNKNIATAVRKFLGGGVKYGRKNCELTPTSKLRVMQKVQNPALLEFLAALKQIKPVKAPDTITVKTKVFFTKSDILQIKSQKQPVFTPTVANAAKPAEIMLKTMVDFYQQYQAKYQLGKMKLNLLYVRDCLWNYIKKDKPLIASDYAMLATDTKENYRIGYYLSETNKLTVALINKEQVIDTATKQLPSFMWHTLVDLTGYLDHPYAPEIRVVS